MRNLVSIIMVLALVITTTMAPAVSHAMPHNHAKATQAEKSEKAEAPADHDCHGHDEAKADSHKTADNHKAPAGGKCCEKGVCKCVGGTCHNGLSKILGNNSTSLAAVSSSASVFAFNNQFVDSAFPSRLKRPPKA